MLFWKSQSEDKSAAYAPGIGGKNASYAPGVGGNAALRSSLKPSSMSMKGKVPPQNAADKKKADLLKKKEDEQKNHIKEYWDNYNISISLSPQLFTEDQATAAARVKRFMKKVIFLERLNKALEQKRNKELSASILALQSLFRGFQERKAYKETKLKLDEDRKEKSDYWAFKQNISTKGLEVKELMYQGSQRDRLVMIQPKTMRLVWGKKMVAGLREFCPWV